MPELPEVTTIVSGINKYLKKLTIVDVWTDWPKIVKSPKFDIFKKDKFGSFFCVISSVIYSVKLFCNPIHGIVKLNSFPL